MAFRFLVKFAAHSIPTRLCDSGFAADSKASRSSLGAPSPVSSRILSRRPSDVIGMMPGRMGIVTPAARADSTKRSYSSTRKNNWVIARLAPAFCLASSTSMSWLRVADSGCPLGKAATATRSIADPLPFSFIRSATRSLAWGKSPRGASSPSGRSPLRAKNWVIPASTKEAISAVASCWVLPTQVIWARGDVSVAVAM